MEERLAINLQLGERLLPDLVQWLLCRRARQREPKLAKSL